MDKKGFRTGRYELISKIAAGGMGEIYLARQRGTGEHLAAHFDKRVALKLLLPHLSGEPDFVKMFLDEARIASQLNHPNIVQILDLGEDGGRYYLAMALVEGVPLSRILRACRQRAILPPLPIVRLIASSLCDALSYAHEARDAAGQLLGLVHRDVTPSNIMVSFAGTVLLTDFGIAKARDNLHHTKPGESRGKYGYMAPEQLRRVGPMDRRVDVFATAVMLYELLTLQHPYQRQTELETMRAIVMGEAPPELLELRPELSGPMRAGILRGLATDPAHRFATARALRDAVLDGHPAAAHELAAWVELVLGPELDALRLPTSGEMPILETASGLVLLEDLGPETRPERHNASSSTGRPTVPSPPEPSPPRRLPKPAVLAAVAAVLLAGAGLAQRWASAGDDPAPPEEVVQASRVEPEAGPPLLLRPVAAPEEKGESAANPVVTPAEQAVVPSAPQETVAAAPVPAPRIRKSELPARPAPDPDPKPVPASAPVPAPAPARQGQLRVDAEPWAEVWMGKRVLGTTPFTVLLPEGDHVLVFRNPHFSGEQRATVKVRGDEVEKVRIRMAP